MKTARHLDVGLRQGCDFLRLDAARATTPIPNTANVAGSGTDGLVVSYDRSSRVKDPPNWSAANVTEPIPVVETSCNSSFGEPTLEPTLPVTDVRMLLN